MTNKTFTARVNKTKINRGSNSYTYITILLMTGNRVYTCHTSGKGRFCTNIDRTGAVVYDLISIGLKENRDFVTGNDSPRGGKTGNYVELTTIGKRKMVKN
jgi:hypothetical protein